MTALARLDELSVFGLPLLVGAACRSATSPLSDSPSMVCMLAPCACTASIRQDRTMSPSTRTVQAPQTPCSQPTWVPVS